MKSIKAWSVVFIFFALMSNTTLAQSPDINIDLTSSDVVSQGQTGTCWSFSTTSFLESESHRITGELHDFSEMAAVRVVYPEKVERYVRYQGKHQFGPGGLSHDVTHAAAAYGLVPQSIYDGGQTTGQYDHGALDASLEALAKTMVGQSGSIAQESFDAVEAVLDAHLGALPESFEYDGKSYTPVSFRDAMGIDPEAYVTLTSFTHHPFGAPFILEVPDNHAHGAFWNVPLDDLERMVRDALSDGYTIAWDADVSNRGFSFQNGWAIMPEAAASAKEWETLGQMPDEPAVSQAMRQSAFDSQENTDDHLMHIVGLAKDAKGRAYFIIKNSWGQGNAFGGRQFVSMPYFRHHTIGIMLHEDGLSKTDNKAMGR
jgi:bleomycin hydrolase